VSEDTDGRTPDSRRLAAAYGVASRAIDILCSPLGIAVGFNFSLTAQII